MKNYLVTDSKGVVTKFNVDYVVNDIGANFFKDKTIQKQFVLYLNGPESAKIMNSLNLLASVAYKFKSTYPKTEGQMIEGTIDIVVKAVDK